MNFSTFNVSNQAEHAVADDEPPSAEQHQTTLEIQQTPGVDRTIDLDWLGARISDALPLVMKKSARPVGRIGVVIANDEYMIQLNRTHTKLDKTTDVLSFDLSDGDPHAPVQADIAVCADEAVRRSSKLGHSIERELLLYSIHGILHCAGFDDQTEAGYAAMHAEEDRILEAIGVGATFQPPASRSRGLGEDSGDGGDAA